MGEKEELEDEYGLQLQRRENREMMSQASKATLQ